MRRGHGRQAVMSGEHGGAARPFVAPARPPMQSKGADRVLRPTPLTIVYALDAPYARASSTILATVACSSDSCSSLGIHCWAMTGHAMLNFMFSISAYTCLGPSGAQP